MDIDRIDLDMLREVANVGAGNAANALSIMSGKTVEISVPHCEVIGYADIGERLGGADQIILGMLVQMCGDLDGYVLFTQSLEDARTMLRDLAHVDVAPAETNIESYEAMREMANILVGTYLSAIAEMAHLKILASVPEMTIDMTMAIMNIPVLVYGHTSDKVLLLDAEFGSGGRSMNGAFLMIPTPASLDRLKEALLGTA